MVFCKYVLEKEVFWKITLFLCRLPYHKRDRLPNVVIVLKTGNHWLYLPRALMNFNQS